MRRPYGQRFMCYNNLGATGHMSNTRKGMYEYKPCKVANVWTASNQYLPVLGIGKLHFRVMKETRTGLISREVLDIPRLKGNLLSLDLLIKLAWMFGRMAS